MAAYHDEDPCEGASSEPPIDPAGAQVRSAGSGLETHDFDASVETRGAITALHPQPSPAHPHLSSAAPADQAEILDPVHRPEILCLLARENETLLASLLSALNQASGIRARGECVDRLMPTYADDLHLLMIDWKLMAGAWPYLRLAGSSWSTPAMILFADWPDTETLSDLVLEGVAGCIVMPSPAQLYRKAIEAWRRGELWFPREALARAIERLIARRKHALPLDDGTAIETDGTAAARLLSEREHGIAALVRGGLSNKEIAHRLGISDETVKKHLARIFRRLGVRNRTQLVLMLNLGRR